ncbi:phage tail tape measure protein [Streptomyces sp. NRRL S-15]|uniref:phage tail tape measure protein n=1 Tax=Streptomyces sp. NRRL S-15 TaxID=1463886 RepID=UPI0004C83679|nr:phage tail tape measure protein [Streptomyces sp. NRRL S-15]
MPRAGAVWVDVLPNMSGFGRQLEREIGEPVARASNAAGQAGGDEMVTGMGSKLKAGGALLGVALGAAIAASTVKQLQKEKTADRLAAQLGLSGKGAARAGKVAGSLYSKAVVDSFEDGAATVRAVMGSGLIDSKASTRSIEQITTKVSDLATTFDQDLTTTANAAAQMLRTGLAKDGAQALDLLTRGLQGPADKAGDLLDTVNEYGTQWRKMGLDGATGIGLLNQAVRAGARDADVAADALKEFSIRAVDGSDGTAAGFKALGLEATSMATKFGQGGKVATQALDLTLDRLRAIEDPIKREAAAVALFGTQAEDLGDSLYSMDPSTAAAGLGKVGGAAKKVGDTIRSNTSTRIEVLKRQFTSVLGRLVTSVVLPGINGMITATRWLGDAIESIGGWISKWGAWLIPVAVLIGGITLALNAQAIATGLTLGVMGAYSLAIRGIAAVTRGWAAAQALFNAVMALNPVTLIIIGVVALGAALVVAYQKSETFRNIVNGVWSAIQSGWNTLWAFLKPGVNAFMTGLQAVGAAASWLWSTVLSPVFGFIGTAVKILVTAVVVIALLPIIATFKVLAAVASWLWTSVLSPVFSWIGEKAVWLWDSAIKPAWDSLQAGIRAVGAVASWLWTSVFSPVFSWIGDKAAWLWTEKIKPAWDFIKVGIGLVGDKIKDLWNTYAKPIFQWIGDKAAWLWDKALKPAFDAGKKGVAALGEGFTKAKDAIKGAWDKLQNIAKKPIRFIIDKVYNGGIVPVWNKVAGAFGAPKLEKQSLKGFSRGGVNILSGQSSYRDGDDQLVPLRRGEGIAVSEAMRDPYERSRLLAVNDAAMHGKSLRRFQGEGFAKGGIFGWVKNAASRGVDLASAGVSWLKDGVKASAEAGLNSIVKPLLNKISGSASMYRDMVTGIPKKMIKDIIGYSGRADSAMEKAGIGGKGFKGALSWARTQAGKAYQWGGNGNPSWDCSGFVSAIESVIRGQKPHRRWATGAFSGATAPPGWVLGARSPYQIGITNAGVGHTAGTINGVNVESRGGDGVVVGSRARSYNDPLFTHRYGLRGFADGGRPRKGELAWVGERGPELLRFGSSDSEVYDHRTSMRMAPHLGPVRGFAKGTSKAKRPSKIATDLSNFKDSLTGTASKIASAAKKLAADLTATGKAGKTLAKATAAASTKLQKMANQRDAVTAKIKEAKAYAADKTSGMNDFLGVSNFGDATTISGLISGMQDRQATARDFTASLATLQKRGGSADLIAQLAEMGPDSQLAGMVSRATGADLKQINSLVASGSRLSTSYGRSMADLMFDAGKDASRGFLTGLIGQEEAIQKAMSKLGASAIKAIRSKKGIDAHSPSRKGAQAGADVGAGVVAGMASMGPAVATAAERLGEGAVPAAALVPVTSQRSAADPVAALDGAAIALVLDDGTRLAAHFDARVDAKLTTARRTARAGTKRR